MPNPGPAVEIKFNEVIVTSSLEDAIKRLKRRVTDEGILAELKARSAFEKPSVKKRRKAREAVERTRLNALREALVASGEWEKRKKRKDKRKAEKLEQKIRRQEGAIL